MVRKFIVGLPIAVMVAALGGSAALAQSAKDGQINDGTFPPGFDCNSLSGASAKLECKTFEQNRTPDNDVVPGTPAIPMPGDVNGGSDDALREIGPNPGPLDFTHGKNTGHNG